MLLIQGAPHPHSPDTTRIPGRPQGLGVQDKKAFPDLHPQLQLLCSGCWSPAHTGLLGCASPQPRRPPPP